jgi:uncharacterized protein (DUF58 family)
MDAISPRSGPKVRDPEAILNRLEWTVLRRLDGLLQGGYRTLFRGFGLDLADIREYQYGDEVRHIDWNVTARLQTPYVREYHEDRDLTAWFLVDLSRSLDFGTAALKQSVATRFVAALARLLTRHGNRVGAMLYGTSVDEIIPARAGRRHVLYLLHRMMTRPALSAGEGTDLGALLRGAFGVLNRRSLVFVVSDFISSPGWAKPLAQLARRHEVLAAPVGDPLERELPMLGALTIEDAETGEQLFVDTNDRGFRRRFAAAAQRREEGLRAAFRDAGVDALELSTEDDLLDAIRRFADMRKRRSRLSSGAPMPVHLEVMGGNAP